ncbi:Hsp20/alpha crystallin family protein [Candidatus Omnitrophota bacterium]
MKLVKRKHYNNPFYELEKLHNEINNLFDWSFGSFPTASSGLLETGWTPAVDVYDSKDNVLVKADLPGLKKEDIDVTIKDNTLIIKGEKKYDSEVKDDGYIRTERFCGSFHRAIALPADVDSNKAKAEYKNGTLELTLPKREEAKPKQITVDIK